MSSVHRKRGPVNPVAPSWAWIQRPLWPCDLAPAGLPGMLLINGVPYMLVIHADLMPAGPSVTTSFRLIKCDGTLYDLLPNCSACDCADATFRSERPGGCKHCVAVRQALAAIGYPVDDPKPTPPRPLPFTAQELADAEAVALDKWGNRFSGQARELTYADEDWSPVSLSDDAA